MLILTRRIGEYHDESVDMETPDGYKIKVIVLSVSGNAVRLGFKADKEVAIFRNEVTARIANEEKFTNSLRENN